MVSMKNMFLKSCFWGIALIHFGTLSANEQVLIEDKALFKIKDLVFFETDYKNFLNRVREFVCIYPDQSFLDLVELSKAQLSYKGFDSGNSVDQKLVKLLKLIIFSKSQKVAIQSEVKSLMEKAARMNKCTKDGKIDMRHLDLMRGEIYLRARFNLDTFWLTQEETDRLVKSNPKVNKELLVKKEKENKMKQAMQIFIVSLDRQIGHSFFNLE